MSLCISKVLRDYSMSLPMLPVNRLCVYLSCDLWALSYVSSGAAGGAGMCAAPPEPQPAQATPEGPAHQDHDRHPQWGDGCCTDAPLILQGSYICHNNIYTYSFNLNFYLNPKFCFFFFFLHLWNVKNTSSHFVLKQMHAYVLSIRSQRRCLRRSFSAPCKLTWRQPSVHRSSCSCCWWRCSASHKPSSPRNSRSCWAPQPSSTQTTSLSKNTGIGLFVGWEYARIKTCQYFKRKKYLVTYVWEDGKLKKVMI